MDLYNLAVVLITLIGPAMITLTVIKNRMGFFLGLSTGTVIGVWSGVIDKWWVGLVILGLAVIIFSSFNIDIGSGGGEE